MLVAACVLPHPPVLVPEVAVQSPDWLEKLRTLCLESVARLVATEPDVVAVVGSAAAPGRWDAGAGGSMAAYGVAVGFGGPSVELPLAPAIGAWALDQVGWAGQRTYVAVDGSASVDECTGIGRNLVADGRCALLVMGDGSAKRSEQAPGYLDDRAVDFDARVVDALARRDARAIADIDPAIAEELWVAGLPAWRVLAGAVGDTAGLESRVRYAEAPTGVGYFVIDMVRRS